MDEAFDELTTFLQNSTDGPLTVAQNVVETEVAPPVITARQPPVRQNDLLFEVNRERFTMGIVSCKNNGLISLPETTTCTLEGVLSNLTFKEEEAIKILEPTARVVMIKCNWGKKIFAGYTEPVKIKTSSRGRKKKEKVVSRRKKQGDGTCFNSQMTFVVANIDCSKLYKFKIFRNGNITLPGAHPSGIDDILECAGAVCKLLTDNLQTAHPVNLLGISPVMKNYKFVVELMPTEELDLCKLKAAIIAYDHATMDLRLYDIKYTREDTRLLVKMGLTSSKKVTSINIFMSGKINLLGAYDAPSAEVIYQFLVGLFARQRTTLVATKYIPERQLAKKTTAPPAT